VLLPGFFKGATGGHWGSGDEAPMQALEAVGLGQSPQCWVIFQ